MRTERTTQIVGNLILVVICLAFLVGAIGFFVRFTNGFTDDFKSFYLEYKGQRIMQSESTLSFPKDKTVKLGCKYALDFFGVTDAMAKGFSVAITPNVTEDNDFDFAVGTDVYSFSEIGDLTDCFNLIEYENCITFEVSDMQTVLTGKYPGHTIILPNSALGEDYFYKMVITSSSGKISYTIYFNCTPEEAT